MKSRAIVQLAFCQLELTLLDLILVCNTSSCYTTWCSSTGHKLSHVLLLTRLHRMEAAMQVVLVMLVTSLSMAHTTLWLSTVS